jgi:YHS domain-containing protein
MSKEATEAIERKRYQRILMRSRIFLDGPAAIYGQAKALGLSEEQEKQLDKIQKEARDKALAVLTAEQRAKLGKVPNVPMTLMQVYSQMMGGSDKTMLTPKWWTCSMHSQIRLLKPGKCPICSMDLIAAPRIEPQQTLCPVMGGPINKRIFAEYKDKKVYFCCAACRPKFEQEPQKYLDKLPQFKEAEPAVPVEKASAVIEQKTCPIMGGAINKKTFTKYKGKKVYFCCPGCKPAFEKNPQEYTAKLPQFKD